MSTSSTDRLALRLGALRAARRRRNVRDGAWAAERLRLPGIVLDRSDARYAHDAIVRFGHALRLARARQPWKGDADLRIVPMPPFFTTRAGRVLLVAGVSLLLLFAFLFIVRPRLEEAGGDT